MYLGTACIRYTRRGYKLACRSRDTRPGDSSRAPFQAKRIARLGCPPVWASGPIRDAEQETPLPRTVEISRGHCGGQQYEGFPEVEVLFSFSPPFVEGRTKAPESPHKTNALAMRGMPSSGLCGGAERATTVARGLCRARNRTANILNVSAPVKPELYF